MATHFSCGRTTKQSIVSIAYIAGTAAPPAFTDRFQEDLSTPGPRIPITAGRDTFDDAVALGRTVISGLEPASSRVTGGGRG